MDIKNLKVGDKVQIKSRRWYNKNKNEYYSVQLPVSFVSRMSDFCGKVVTISYIDEYTLKFEEDSDKFYFHIDSIYKKVK